MARLFGTSGIRGIFGKDLTLELASGVGLALGTRLKEGKVLIGRDPRTSSLALEDSLVSGLESTGMDVLRAGMVPTPVLAYSVREVKANAGVMVTASHNPPEYNGIKLWNRDSSAYDFEQEQEIEALVGNKKFNRTSWGKIGHSQSMEVTEQYIERIKNFVNIQNKYKVVLDCGHGANSIVSPRVLKPFSKNLRTIFSIPDGNFPGRKPEPKKSNLSELIRQVKKSRADVGFAHDGDGDRVAVVDEQGKFVEQDKLLALVAKNELKGRKKGVVVPVDTSKLVEDFVGKVIQTKVGDVNIARELKKRKGIFGGEPSGCFIFPGAHFCPDGILGSLKVLELLGREERKLSELVKELPTYYTLRKQIHCRKDEKAKAFRKISGKVRAMKGIKRIISIDGIKAEFFDSWVLVRESGTEPIIRVTVEAKERKKASNIMRNLT